MPTELAHQLDQVLFRESAGIGTEMLRGKASQTGTDAARRAEQAPAPGEKCNSQWPAGH